MLARSDAAAERLTGRRVTPPVTKQPTSDAARPFIPHFSLTIQKNAQNGDETD